MDVIGNVAGTNWKTITLHSLPVLVGAVFIGVLAGQILSYYQDRLFAIPILLALVPAINGIGGNVGSVLGSRVASGLHFGGLWSNQARGFRTDLLASVILTVVTFTFLGAFAYLVAPLLGLTVTMSLSKLALTTLLAGLGLIVVMILLVIVVGMLSHRFGWDPDNLVVPVLTTAGDTLGIVFLLLAGEVVGL
ncbi:MAG: magnesium transporter [Thermoplasmatota archaeon]